jgi:hypothetical protein
MKQDRFLMIILGVIGLLVISSVVLFFIRQEPQDYGLEDTPEGVVRNYILALQKGDHHRAYAYLQDDENKPAFTEFQQSNLQVQEEISRTAVQLGEVEITGDQARVGLTIIHTNGGPFNRSWDQVGTALLTLQKGEWRIINMPYPYWGWEWYIKERL